MLDCKVVINDNLAPLLLLDKDMEPAPEPFRMQGNVLLLVPFLEYVNFIDYYLDKVNYLSTPTHQLKQYVSDKNFEKLYQSFLMDMAFAVAKELHYAEANKRDATFIAHSCDDADVKSISDIEQMYQGVKKYTAPTLYQHMGERDFQLPKVFRKNNELLWNYANALMFFAKAPGKAWVFNKEELIS